MTPIGGGVHIQAHQAIESDNLVVDEKGVIDEAKVDDKIGKLTFFRFCIEPAERGLLPLQSLKTVIFGRGF